MMGVILWVVNYRHIRRGTDDLSLRIIYDVLAFPTVIEKFCTIL